MTTMTMKKEDAARWFRAHIADPGTPEMKMAYGLAISLLDGEEDASPPDWVVDAEKELDAMFGALELAANGPGEGRRPVHHCFPARHIRLD